MEFDANGLPLPGRELDRWMAENVFDREPLNARHGLHENGDIEYYWGYPIGHDLAPAYSTTHAFFQVMEAMSACDWMTSEDSERLYVTVCGADVAEAVIVLTADYPDREHAYAHAVCACVWKALGGEG